MSYLSACFETPCSWQFIRTRFSCHVRTRTKAFFLSFFIYLFRTVISFMSPHSEMKNQSFCNWKSASISSRSIPQPVSTKAKPCCLALEWLLGSRLFHSLLSIKPAPSLIFFSENYTELWNTFQTYPSAQPFLTVFKILKGNSLFVFPFSKTIIFK